ncbi:MAG: twin-arginine translocation signal domain-containing protein [Verrucomicrobia bacterium]|nr:twin-arginine translocation signal domain-containing protein [Verrucomicrobiota bacterium]NBU09663.1 twin-arginine translocation signal domain-containing protein [Pseudomonadota bacterium]NDA66892.1 twin-arginine translocation signal domain-containing protein [Verrucomicrobiota bacterium]NDB75646.1 twin-arginine translocation signal domain-containing protein [Verrucomicrobiota bacterium]NDD38748.1 twin-arginine translocation signal domain-containing protein [Verrucomicrobiota bacterium]
MHLTRRDFLQQASLATLAATGCATVGHAPNSLIIDTHQHLWDLGSQKLPWLGDAPALLRKNYRTEEYRAATAGLNVRAVYMEVDVAESTLANEAEFILALAAAGQTPTRAAVIGGRPDAPDFSAYVKRFAKQAAFKGVRRVLHSPATPPGYCLKPEFVRGVRLLGEQGKSFDLCMRAPELMDAAKLTELCPGTRFVLDHCGNPDLKCFRASRPGEERPRHTADEWKRSIDALAKRPNVIGKISGVAASLTKGGGVEDLAPAVNHCLDAFGPDRVVFGGDWPVCLLGATYQEWVTMLRQIVASRPAEQQRKLWSLNAIRHYSLKV